MTKQEVLKALQLKGYPITEGALRTYVGKKYRLIEPSERNVGKSNMYTLEQLELIEDIHIYNRLGIPLHELKHFMSNANKFELLKKQMLRKKYILEKQKQQIDAYLELIKYVENESECGFEPKTLYQRFFLRGHCADTYCEVYDEDTNLDDCKE